MVLLPRVSFIIPCRNEEGLLAATLEKAQTYFQSQRYPYEIIVVDDGSADKTAAIAGAVAGKNSSVKLIRHTTHQGKGAAVVKGITASSGEFVFFSDADLSTPVQTIEIFMRFLEEGDDCVCASRCVAGSRIISPEPWLRGAVRRFFSILQRAVSRSPIRDSQCGFKGFRQEAARTIASCVKERGYIFDVELLTLARIFGLHVREVGVSWNNAQRKRTHIFSDGIVMCFCLLNIWYRATCGRYQKI